MANNYVETSSFLAVPADKLGRVQAIIDRVTTAIHQQEMRDSGLTQEEIEAGETLDMDIACSVEVMEDGVWLYSDDYCNLEHVEQIARAIIEELELDEPFICSYAETCSKPRIDNFGGGAFVVSRGRPTYWVNATAYIEDIVRSWGNQNE